MKTIKAYTDIPQSKKLAEILPIESADMWFANGIIVARDGVNKPDDIKSVFPCWSLAALLEVLPKEYYPIKDHKTNLILGKPKDKWCVLYWDATGMQHGEETLADNPVDACVEMIIKLNEQNLL